MQQVKNDSEVSKSTKIISVKVILVLLLLISTLGLFAWITHQVVFEKHDLFDTSIKETIRPYNTPGMRSVMQIFTFIGSTTFLLPTYIILIAILISKKRKTYAINAAIIAVSSFLLVKGLKLIFRRERPNDPFITQLDNFSFPSGHSVSAFVLISILMYAVWNLKLSKVSKWLLSLLLVLIAICVGLSRIMLGVHYPSDVIAGFSLAAAWVIICSYILSKVNSPKV